MANFNDGEKDGADPVIYFLLFRFCSLSSLVSYLQTHMSRRRLPRSPRPPRPRSSSHSRIAKPSLKPPLVPARTATVADKHEINRPSLSGLNRLNGVSRRKSGSSRLGRLCVGGVLTRLQCFSCVCFPLPHSPTRPVCHPIYTTTYTLPLPILPTEPKSSVLKNERNRLPPDATTTHHPPNPKNTRPRNPDIHPRSVRPSVRVGGILRLRIHRMIVGVRVARIVRKKRGGGGRGGRGIGRLGRGVGVGVGRERFPRVGRGRWLVRKTSGRWRSLLLGLRR